MSHCIEKLPHDCGSSNGLQVFQDDSDKSFSGYCFACDTYVPDPYNGKTPVITSRKVTKSPEQIQEELAETAALPTVALPHRSLRKETLEYFGAKVALSEVDGVTPVVYYLPYIKDNVLTGYKAKFVPEKKMWGVGDLKGNKEMFGWRQAMAAKGFKLFITEGEEDAMALYQALLDKQAGGKYADRAPSVVSLSNGSGGASRDIGAVLQQIKAFKEVVLVFDNDEAGKKAVRDVLQLIPAAQTVTLAEKDANAMVMAGKSMALANAVLFGGEKPKNTRLVLGSSQYDAGRVQAAYGLSYPWEGMTKLTRGMRFGETYYAGAGVKMGKTTLRSALVEHLITEHGIKVFMAAPEETNKKSWQLVCSQAAGKIFHDPDVPFDFDAYDKASKVIGDNLVLVDLYQRLDWPNLKNDIIMAANDGCRAVFIDPITNLTNGVASGEANTVLQEISQDLAAIALDMNLIVWIFCHLKAPDGGDSHERGGKVLSHQFAGSRAMMRSCHMMIGLEGNKDPDLPDEVRNQRKLVVLEDREFGASGLIKVFYSPKTGKYSEIKDGH